MARSFGYAWAIETEQGYTLCHWAEPDRKRLEGRSKPSPEAKVVRVELVPTPTKANRKLFEGGTER